MEQGAGLDEIVDASPLKAIEGLSQHEVLTLAVVAGEAFVPDVGVSVHAAKNDADRAGLTSMGFNIAVRKLCQKGFIETMEMQDDFRGDPYTGLRVLDRGWQWIEANEGSFSLFTTVEKKRKSSGHDIAKDDIPF